jgi:hypothetical protein
MFDLSFTEFITPRIIKGIFILAVTVSAIGALILVVAGFNEGFGSGVASIVGAGILFVLYVLMSRVYLEFVIAVFRIAENTTVMAANNKN